jgi:hypothetical protein
LKSLKTIEKFIFLEIESEETCILFKLIAAKIFYY